MSLANMRMVWKVLVLVALGGLGMATVAGLAWRGMAQADASLDRLTEVARRATAAAQLNQTVLVLAAAEADALALTHPTPERVAAAEAKARDARARFRELIATFRNVDDPDRVARINAADDAFAKLDTAVTAAIALARRTAADGGRLDDAQVAAHVTAAQPLEAAARQITRTMTDNNIRRQEDSAKAADDALSASQVSLLAGIAASMLVMAAAGWWIATRSIAAPLGQSVRSIQGLADGRLDTDIAGATRRDEIGDIARALAGLRGNLAEARVLQEKQLATAEADARRAQVLAELTRRFEDEAGAVTRSVASSATELQATATAMSATAEEARRQSGAVVAATQEASSNVQTVAAAAEELSASVSEIARQVTESARVANEAVAEAERTNATVAGLSDAAGRIGDVVRLINDIAGQTNLLALNATIEAARAGEAGKGFAVVASEVKTLASQTARATEEIGAQIQAMQAATGQTVTAIGAIGRTIGRINEISGAIAAAVEEQGAATADIARNVQAAAQGTAAIDQGIGSVNEAAAATGSATTQVLGAAHELSIQAEALRNSVERFLGEMKAA